MPVDCSDDVHTRVGELIIHGELERVAGVAGDERAGNLAIHGDGAGWSIHISHKGLIGETRSTDERVKPSGERLALERVNVWLTVAARAVPPSDARKESLDAVRISKRATVTEGLELEERKRKEEERGPVLGGLGSSSWPLILNASRPNSCSHSISLDKYDLPAAQIAQWERMKTSDVRDEALRGRRSWELPR
jgi:hypothetical protein